MTIDFAGLAEAVLTGKPIKDAGESAAPDPLRDWRVGTPEGRHALIKANEIVYALAKQLMKGEKQ